MTITKTMTPPMANATGVRQGLPRQVSLLLGAEGKLERLESARGENNQLLAD
jgi:hypothetical protein